LIGLQTVENPTVAIAVPSEEIPQVIAPLELVEEPVEGVMLVEDTSEVPALDKEEEPEVVEEKKVAKPKGRPAKNQ
jgi:hypothetical protein